MRFDLCHLLSQQAFHPASVDKGQSVCCLRVRVLWCGVVHAASVGVQVVRHEEQVGRLHVQDRRGAGRRRRARRDVQGGSSQRRRQARWPLPKFPCMHLHISRKTFRVTTSRFLEIFPEISTHTPSQIFRTAHAGCVNFLMWGHIKKYQYLSLCLTQQPYVAREKSKILTKYGCFGAKFSRRRNSGQDSWSFRFRVL